MRKDQAAAALLLSFNRLPPEQRREAIKAWIEWQTAIIEEPTLAETIGQPVSFVRLKPGTVLSIKAIDAATVLTDEMFGPIPKWRR